MKRKISIALLATGLFLAAGSLAYAGDDKPCTKSEKKCCEKTEKTNCNKSSDSNSVKSDEKKDDGKKM